MPAVLDFLEGLYAQLDVAGFARRVVTALPRLIATDIASFNEVDARTGRYRTVVAPVGSDRFPGSEEIFERHVREHPYITGVRRFEDGRAHPLSEFVSAARFRGSAIYNEYYRRLGTESQLAVRLPGATAPWVRGVALSRGRRDYSAAERHLLTALAPHLVQAYRTAELLERACPALDAGAPTPAAPPAPTNGDPPVATDGEPPGPATPAAEMVLLSSTGRVQFATPRARGWLTAYFGGSTARDGRVPPRLLDWIGSGAMLLEDGDGVPRPREPLVVARDGGRLEIRVVDHGRSLLVREHRATPSSKALLALGLSPRESQVLAWVVEGKTNGEVGAILGARPRTVAKHLERIFRKLGVETRTAAAASVLSHPGAVG
jgi:DNA-binding CsgD family transcriptional regulator